MPWKKNSEEEQRYSFLQQLRRAPRGGFAGLCRVYQISRKTGYKWLQRSILGESLCNRVCRPQRLARSYNDEWRMATFEARARFPTWGASKLRWFLRHNYKYRKVPSVRTLHRWLKGAQLVVARPWCAPSGPAQIQANWIYPHRANDVWSIDFKGWFRTGDGTRVYALTVCDMASHFILAIVVVEKMDFPCVQRALTQVFKKYGLPRAIRADQGAPWFGTGPRHWTKLSVWWVRQQIQVQYTRRAKPQDNAAHEQMHKILKAETAQPPAPTLTAQKARLTKWKNHYNYDRPHASHQENPPATKYRFSARPFLATLPILQYPISWDKTTVYRSGYMSWRDSKRIIGKAFYQQSLGLRKINPTLVAVYLGPHLLGTLSQSEPGLRPVSIRLKGGC